MPTTSRRAMVDAGFDIIENRRPSFLLGGSVLITGEVDRTTSFEQGFAVHQAYRDDRWEPDPLILDDQALIVHVRDRGLVVLTGCGHAGIVNIVRYAQRLTNVSTVHAVIGGFHLSGPLFAPIIGATCDALARHRARRDRPRALHRVARGSCDRRTGFPTPSSRTAWGRGSSSSTPAAPDRVRSRLGQQGLRQ